MSGVPKAMFGYLKETVAEFTDDCCMRMAAALAYYTVFALPPLFVILLMVLGLYYSATGQGGTKAAQAQMKKQVTMIVGPEASGEVQGMISAASLGKGAWWKWLLSIAGVVVSATGLVAALQNTLNEAWDVMPDPNAGGIRSFVMKRVLSLGMILGVGFLLLVSTLLTAVVAKVVGGGGEILTTLVSFVVVTLLFAGIFRYLPDVNIVWEDVWVGALITAFLFSVGKLALSYYLASGSVAAEFSSGAASLAVLLAWVYYSALILLFGAEFTQVWARRHGRGLEPEPGAVKMVEQTKAEAATGRR